MTKEAFKGLSLFNDIEDCEIRYHNRAAIMVNVAEDNTFNNKINTKGALTILGYFNSIPEEERIFSLTKFKELMKDRGYSLVTEIAGIVQ